MTEKSGRLSVESLAAATPTDRDRAMDFLRVVAIGSVVGGHWFMAVLLRDGTATNVLVEVPWTQALTWVFQVMPLFFFVGGFVHLKGVRSLQERGGNYADFLRLRVERLMFPTLVFLAVWVTIALGIDMSGHRGGLAEIVTMTVVQPLWFIGVYLGVIALAWPMAALHRRFGGWVIAALAAAVMVVDMVRFASGITAIAAVNFALVWLCVHQLGYGYADGLLTRSVGWVMAGAGLGVLLLTTVLLGWYPLSMVGLPEAEVSNMNPPTFALLAHAMWLVGVAVLLLPAIRRWMARRAVWTGVVAANAVAMTTFLWHLTALFAVYSVLLWFRVGLAEPTTVAWWLSRPIWFAVLIVVCVAFVAAFRWAERPRPIALRGGPLLVPTLALVALCGGILGLSLSGLDNLRTGGGPAPIGGPINAAASLILIGSGWLALRRS